MFGSVNIKLVELSTEVINNELCIGLLILVFLQILVKNLITV